MNWLDWRMIVLAVAMIFGPEVIATFTSLSDLSASLIVSALGLAIFIVLAFAKARSALATKLLLGFGLLFSLGVLGPELLEHQFGLSTLLSNVAISVPVFIFGFGSIVWLAREGYID